MPLSEPEQQGTQPPPEPNSPASNPEDGVNADLIKRELLSGHRQGDRYARVQRVPGGTLRHVSPGHFRATRASTQPRNRWQAIRRTIKGAVIGIPLATQREAQERLNKLRALAVFASDAISSCAYATEEILIVLAAAGSGALGLSIPISLLIAVLLSVVAFSYRQTVYAYPTGGGSYIVARGNIGEIAGLVAAAALMLDYILTVSVSISSGTDAITSAFPILHPLTVPITLLFIGIITVGNLRGIREAGTIFAIPTYAFIVSLSFVLVVGVVRLLTGAGPAEPVAGPPMAPQVDVTPWLLLTAFSAGSVAMSGTEAISNGVPAFQKPESHNAATTLTIMATLLGIFFLGISFLASHFALAPSPTETIVSQLGRAVLGRNLIYYVFQFATMGILVIAANTSFADFPRLASLLARDNYLPHQFGRRGDRLAFSTGIIALGVIAGALILIFQGDVHLLIPLYAVGVFLAFTLSQAGMVLHHRRTREPHWQRNAIINGAGAVLTGIVLVIAVATKFIHGAWVIVLAVPLIVTLFLGIQHHYRQVAEDLKLKADDLPPLTFRMIVLVIVPSLNYATERALIFARTISHHAIALVVDFDPEHGEKVREAVREKNPDLAAIVIQDPYRSFFGPIQSYVDTLRAHNPSAFITIVLPEFIVKHWWETFLHNRGASRLARIFHKYPNVAIVNVPYVLGEPAQDGDGMPQAKMGP